MAIKKSELYSSLWESCDALRGGMDASQYKDYVLVLLFMKYVSDKAASRRHYDLTVPEGGSFAAMVAAKGKPDIGDRINKIIGRLAEANENLKGAIDVADFNDESKLGKGKDMVDRLTELVSIFARPELDFRRNTAEGDDLLGDAYEYLMRNFATESGKSKGQFYTPAEVSRVMAQVIGLGSSYDSTQSIYDPTCGSGSLLLKAHDEAKSRTGLDLAIYGQENDYATSGLARMNMVLHDATTAVIWKDNTLSSPYFLNETGGLKTFDFVVANPPFSNKRWTHGFDPAHDKYRRFSYGLPPDRNGDYAFLLHVLASLKSTGTGAIVMPHGVLFRGNAEAVIRSELVKRGFIAGIIGLPPNLFYGTGIPACIVVLDKSKAATRKGIFMVDASRGLIKDGNKNRLRARDVRRIVDAFTGQFDVAGFSRFVPNEAIERNDYNLNLPRYIDSAEPEDIQDIDGHLRGGIPDRDLDALRSYWAVLPELRDVLFESAGRPGYSRPRIPASDVGATITRHPDFVAFTGRIESIYQTWRTAAKPQLLSLAKGSRPKELLASLAESVLTDFADAPLLDRYDFFQCLQDYAAEALQDDAYLVAELGWLEASKPQLIVADKDRKTKIEPDFVVGKVKFHSDLLPRRLMIDEYFAEPAVQIAEGEGRLEEKEAEIGAMAEEHGSEGGLLEEIFDDKGKPDRKLLASRLRETAKDPESAEEYALLKEVSDLLSDITERRAAIRQVKTVLDLGLSLRYGELTEDAVKELAVEHKWLGGIHDAIDARTDQARRDLVSAIGSLEARYRTPLGELTRTADTLSARVTDLLRRIDPQWMG